MADRSVPSKSTRPPLSTGRMYDRASLRRQLNWFEHEYGMTSAQHCHIRDLWLKGRHPHPIPGNGRDSSMWDSVYHEWCELS